MKDKKRILIACKNSGKLIKLMENEGFFAYSTDDGKQVLSMIYNEPPDLIILSADLDGICGETIIREIKQDNIYSHLPLILISGDEIYNDKIDWSTLPVDDYLISPVNHQELLARVKLTLFKGSLYLDCNPLSRLPGNISIMREIQKRIDQKKIFSLAYIDIDNFKPYNDRYGFARGDEVLRMLSRLITSVILDLNSTESFVGHVGGDDYVFIVPPQKEDEACNQILKNFNLIVRNFYDEQDRIRGQIESKNRQGEKMNFPIMSLSIAIVSNEKRKLEHFGHISSIAAELKKRAKSEGGNTYIKDERSD